MMVVNSIFVTLFAIATAAAAFVPKTPVFASSRRGFLFKMQAAGSENAVAESTGIKLPEIASTAKRLFLVRHGEVINPGGDRPVYYGGMEVPLSDLGKQEAVVAAEYLSQFDLQCVASSPLSRAAYGAKKVQEKQQSNDDVIIYQGLTELDRGAWCGKTKSEIGADMLDRFDACDESVTPDGGESYPDLKRRVLESRDAFLKQISPGRAGAIVSHLQVTRAMLSNALNIPTEQMTQIKVATASITCIDYDEAAGTQTVHFQSFKPESDLQESKDGAN